MRKYVKAVVNLGVALAVFLLVIFLAPRLFFFFAPFVAGWIIAWIASPLVQFFEEKLKIRRKAGSAFVIIAVIGMVVFVLYLAGAKLSREAVGLIEALPGMWEGTQEDFSDIGERLNVVYSHLPMDVQMGISDVMNRAGSYIGDIVGSISTPAINVVGNFALQIPSILIGIIMALLSAYFFVSDRSGINGWFREHMPPAIQSRYRMVRHSLVTAVGGYFKAQLRIEIWMYLLLVIGLTVLQVDYAVLIAVGIAFMDFLPFFGTGTIMVPWAIVKVLSADYEMALGLLIIWGVGQLARQVIQPKIVGDYVGLPALPTLVLLYIGYKLGSVIGMILAVPIGLIIVELYREGAFDTTKNSILILTKGLNDFRRFSAEDLNGLHEKDKK
ncbi:MAG: sporulation integral membrane protein YtvI [Clostridium sp.]|nr:sporulation integral membrane protein YtvI [Clostridium sp.]